MGNEVAVLFLKEKRKKKELKKVRLKRWWKINVEHVVLFLKGKSEIKRVFG